MPYIPQERRVALELGDPMREPGDLAFELWRKILDYVEKNSEERLRYRTAAEVLGVLSSLQLEFARRFLTPLEEAAIRRNGDLEFPYPRPE